MDRLADQFKIKFQSGKAFEQKNKKFKEFLKNQIKMAIKITIMVRIYCRLYFN